MGIEIGHMDVSCDVTGDRWKMNFVQAEFDVAQGLCVVAFDTFGNDRLSVTFKAFWVVAMDWHMEFRVDLMMRLFGDIAFIDVVECSVQVTFACLTPFVELLF